MHLGSLWTLGSKRCQQCRDTLPLSRLLPAPRWCLLCTCIQSRRAGLACFHSCWATPTPPCWWRAHHLLDRSG